MNEPGLTLPARIVSRVGFLAPIRHLVRPFRRGLATVFLLHRAEGIHDGVSGHRPEDVRAILLQLWRSGIRFVPLSRVVAAAHGRDNLEGDVVAFTMDDGYRDQAEVLAPIFIEHECPVTLFVITGLIDGRLWPWDAKVKWLVRHARGNLLRLSWGKVGLEFPIESSHERRQAARELLAIFAGLGPERLKERITALEIAAECRLPALPPPEYEPASWDQIRRLEDGGVSIAPHTVSHSIVSRLPADDASHELTESLARVKAETKSGLPFLAWPVGKTGHFGPRDMSLARAAGFSAALSAGGDYANIRAAAQDPNLAFSLDRTAMPISAGLAVRYGTGLEAAWQVMSRSTIGRSGFGRRSGKPAGSTWKVPIRLARDGVEEGLLRARLLTGRYEHLKRIDASLVRRLVFVCKGNVCRSPFAAAVSNKLGIQAVSCGLDVTRPSSPEQNAVKCGLMTGVDISGHTALSINCIRLHSDDCLVVAEPEQAQQLSQDVMRVGCQITLLGLWREPPVARIPDPYGRSLADFELAYSLIETAVHGLAKGLGRPS